MGARTYVRMTDDQVQQAVALRAQGLSLQDIGRRFGVSSSQVGERIRPDADEYRRYKRAYSKVWRERRDGQDRPPESLKERLLAAVTAQDWPDPHDLTEAVRHGDEGFSDHEVVHILYRLKREGAITFREQKVGKATTLVDIHKRRRRTNGSDRTATTSSAAQVHTIAPAPTPVEAPGGSTTESGTTETTQAPSEPPGEPTGVVWPVLAALRARASAVDRARAMAEALYEAGAMLEAFDPEEARRLATRATDVAEEFTLSPVEDEYLRFAEQYRVVDKEFPDADTA